MKTAEQWAREAWCKLSLGNIARSANFEATVKELAPFFENCQHDVMDEFGILHGDAARRLVEALENPRPAGPKLRDLLAAKPTPPPAVEPRCKCGLCEHCVYGTSPAPAESAGSIKLDRKLAPADPYEGRKVGEVLHEMMTAPAQADPCGRCLGKRVWGDEMCPDCSSPAEPKKTAYEKLVEQAKKLPGHIGAPDPAHATSRGAEPCGTCGGKGTVYVDSGDSPTGYVVELCPEACSPPAATKDEPRRSPVTLVVSKQDFDADPLTWIRKASETQRVHVMDGDTLCQSFSVGLGADEHHDHCWLACRAGSTAGFLENTSGVAAVNPHREGSHEWECWRFGYGSAKYETTRDELARALDEHEAVKAWRAQPRHMQLRILSTMHAATEEEHREIEASPKPTIAEYSVTHDAAVAVLRAVAGKGA